MNDSNFTSTQCPQCQRIIWAGLSSTGIPTKLDTERLNLKEEIVKKIQGVRTYQIHQTSISFQATPRLGARLGAAAPIVLATHICSWNDFNYGSAPDYFGKPTAQTTEVEF